jgi:hypothetical protein
MVFQDADDQLFMPRVYDAAQLFIKMDKADNDMIKRTFTIYVKSQDTRKSNMKPKFFSQISDHQQCLAPVPSRHRSHAPNSAGGR